VRFTAVQVLQTNMAPSITCISSNAVRKVAVNGNAMWLNLKYQITFLFRFRYWLTSWQD